ncbi:MAG: protein-L-isoaspartate O-methyltransferase [Hyphomicrobiales bacterium]|nr:protein-L-isoaspartate O-methyltransferase [Hyphomicrobiales bacterium]
MSLSEQPNASQFLSSPRSVEMRRTMVDCQVRTFDVTDARVLAAMLSTPREPFMAGLSDAQAYSDAPVTARAGGASRRLLVPMVIARALQAAHVAPTDRVLDIGGGCGYTAAVLARLAASVTALEADPAFVACAQAAFSQLGLVNASAVAGDLAAGVSGAPGWDVIFVNGAVEARPEALLASLAHGGRLLAVQSGPGSTHGAGKVTIWEKINGAYGNRPLFDAAADVLPGFARAPAFAF